MARTKSWKGVVIYTIGHSTRTLDDLVSVLRSFSISIVADVRTIPRSRHNPQFNGDLLPAALARQGIRYVHLPRLGGLRRTRKDSTNTGWRNASFRGFADYMLTDDFLAGLEDLRALATGGRVALMCAEAVPWRCHRSLIADALLARRANVEHITGLSRSSPHHLTPFAQVRGSLVTYPGETGAEGRLATQGPFHLEATVRVLQRRPANLVDVWEHEEYHRVLKMPDGFVLAQVRNCGTIDSPDVQFSIRPGPASPATLAAVTPILRTVLGLDIDPVPLQRLTQAEEALRPTLLALRGLRPPRFADLFETFANVVPFQQVSIDSGVATVARLVQRFGRQSEFDGRCFYAFPSAETIAETPASALRDCGMSGKKAEALRQLARMIESGELSEQAVSAVSTRDALEYLQKLPGIGRWSAALVLLRGLGRMDVFPRGDSGVARALTLLIGVQPEGLLESVVERFGEHRGYLYFCVLGGRLLAKGLIHEAPPLAGGKAPDAVSLTRGVGR
jgi:3-methyladenine DNA glycosylase/8-oxoguanine DNA glycosylase